MIVLERLLGVALLLAIPVAPPRQEPPDPTPTPAVSPEVTPAPSAEAAPASAPTPSGTPLAGSAALALCADCHEEQTKPWAANPHHRQPKLRAISPNAVCESCHGDGTAHIESGGDKALIRGFHLWKDSETCASCHRESRDQASFRTGVHANSSAMDCTTCHSIHKPHEKSAALLAKSADSLCATCHVAEPAAFRNKPFAHNLERGGLDCVSCHDPHGRSGRQSLKLTREGELPCVSCHSELRGPFVFEHVAGISGDCTSCHEPHGSSNPMQLKRAQVFQLCLECHSTLAAGVLGSQPPSFHNINSARYRNCTTCHVAVHGSNTSPGFFK
jgi:DmsE family decaheme c-type cytochrome